MLEPDYPIRTARLTLRPYQSTDLDDLYATQSLPEVARFLYWEARDRGAVAESLARKQEESVLHKEGDALCIAVVWDEIDTVVGEVNLFWLNEANQQGEFGFVFNPAYHGKGLASEAAVEILRLGFDQLGLHRIIGRCDAHNKPSVALMERLGLRREAHFIHPEIFKGEWGEELVYAMLASEWQGGAVTPA